MADIALVQRAVDEVSKIVETLTPDQLDAQTPCTEWKVRDLINHLAGGATMFALSAEQGSVPDEELGRLMGGDNLGDDFKGAWRAASSRVMTAFSQPGAMDKIVTLPFGQMPAPVALDFAVFDVTTHAADLAQATGKPMPADDLVEIALETGRKAIGPEMRLPGVFDAEQEASADAAPAQRLLAFAGRRL